MNKTPDIKAVSELRNLPTEEHFVIFTEKKEYYEGEYLSDGYLYYTAAMNKKALEEWILSTEKQSLTSPYPVPGYRVMRVTPVDISVNRQVTVSIKDT